jgi:uncharacterized protein (TIRG00374 family)
LKFTLKSFIKISFFLALGLFFIWIFLRGLTDEQKQEIYQIFLGANYRWIFLSMVFGLLSHASRTQRWLMLLEPMGNKPRFVNTFFALIIAYFANLAVPRLGEISRCGILQRYEKIPFQKSFGTVVTERALDLTTFLITFVIAILWQWKNFALIKETSVFQKFAEKYQMIMESGRLQWAIVLMLLIFMIVLYKYRNKFTHLSLYQKIKSIVEGFVEGLKSLTKVKHPLWFILHTIFIWTMYWIMTWVVFFSLPETSHLGMDVGLLVLAFGTIGIILVQGGIGIYPLLVAEVLIIFGIAKTTGYAMGWLLWSGQTLMIITAGIISMILLPIYNREKNKLAT